ncbi:MAG: 30S ribosomal protein S9 [Nanoarchaeota archaeon]
MSKVIQSSGSRKRAIARATVKSGKGTVRINHVPLENVTPRYAQLRIMEPLMLAGDAAKKLDVNVTVEGGGVTSQADAVRLAIARGLVEYTGDDGLRNAYLQYDRQLLVADVRVKESSKPNCQGKARARRQKSYR